MAESKQCFYPIPDVDNATVGSSEVTIIIEISVACIYLVHAFLVDLRQGEHMKVNGEVIHLDKPMTVREYLEENDYRTDAVVVELDLKILPKEEYGNTILEDLASMEIVHFMGGG